MPMALLRLLAGFTTVAAATLLAGCKPEPESISPSEPQHLDMDAFRFGQMYLSSSSAAVGLYVANGSDQFRLKETLRSSLDIGLPDQLQGAEILRSSVCAMIKPEVTGAFIVVVTAQDPLTRSQGKGITTMPVVETKVVYYCSETRPLKLKVSIDQLRQALRR